MPNSVKDSSTNYSTGYVSESINPDIFSNPNKQPVRTIDSIRKESFLTDWEIEISKQRFKL